MSVLREPGCPACVSCRGGAEQQVARPRVITGVTGGLKEGAGALGSSFMQGFRGLVEKPMQGAALGGVEGALMLLLP